jgi:thiol-disulfide isomerase/thioredoxin
MMKKKLFLAGSLLLVAAAALADPIAVGTKAPAFSLVNAVDSKTVAFKPGDGKTAVVIFTCNQCPFAKAFEPRIIELAKQYAAKGIAFYAVNPNDEVKYPEETLASMRSRAVGKGYTLPYLKDADSAVARAYGAKVTPHAYVVDGKGVVRYVGYIDDEAKPEKRKTTGLTDALDALLAGKAIETTSTNAFGCSIKWKR